MINYLVVIILGMVYWGIGCLVYNLLYGVYSNYLYQEHVIENQSVISYVRIYNDSFWKIVIPLWPLFLVTWTVLHFVFKYYLELTRYNFDRRLLSIANEDL